MWRGFQNCATTSFLRRMGFDHIHTVDLDAQGVDQLVVFIDAQHAVRRQALDGEGAGHANRLLVFVGLVVEVFELSRSRK